MFEEFVISDFAASPELVINMSATLEWVEELVPGGATTRLSLRRVGHNYSCNLDVFTAAGQFSGMGLYSDPQGAFDDAVSKLMGFLRDWRKKRMGTGVSSHLLDGGLN